MKEFEFIILKKLVNSNEFFGKAVPILQKKFFYEIGNQELFALIKGYYHQYQGIPSVTELVACVKNVSNAEIRAEIIKSLQTIKATEEVQNIKFMCDETVEWAKDCLYHEALRIGADGLMKKDETLKLQAQKILDERAKLTIDSDLGLDFDDIEAQIAYYSQRNIGVLTRHKSLNKRLASGFLPGTLSFVLAPPGVGKSLLMTDLISGMIADGKKILMVSLEMGDHEVMKRIHSNALDLPIAALTDLAKTEGELRALDRETVSKDQIISAYQRLKTSGTCGKLYIKEYPSGSFSALMLERLIESFRLEKGINFDIVFVDYIGIMKSDLLTPSAGLYSYVKSIGDEVRAVAKKCNVPIVSASQLNRSATNNIDGSDNSNVSDSLGTVMTADFMLFLLQNEEMKGRGEMVCKCTKNRFSGITDTWMMTVDYTRMRFGDMIAAGDAPVIDEITKATGNSALNDDFGIVTSKKLKEAEEFAKNEIREIVRADYENAKKHDDARTIPKDELDDIYKELGL